MKQTLIILIVTTFLFSCKSNVYKHLNKESYIESRDEGHEGNSKIIKGVFNRQLLESDTAFKWFADNYKYGQPDANAIEAFKKNKEKFSVLVFGGTWCHDTQNILPAFYKLADKSTFSQKKIYLIGVDRAKTTIQELHTKYKITNVPTFIILNNAGKEIGRVVEYGKSGMPDKDLGEIVNAIQ
jgi:thiol-disulfide isomerase/thioredoxin